MLKIDDGGLSNMATMMRVQGKTHNWRVAEESIEPVRPVRCAAAMHCS